MRSRLFICRVKIRVDTPREELRHQRGSYSEGRDIQRSVSGGSFSIETSFAKRAGGILEFPYVLVP